MAWLLIDNSNSRTKFQLGDSEGLIGEKAFLPTGDLESGALLELTGSLEFSGVALASVVPEKARLLSRFFQDSHPFHEISHHQSPLGFGFDLESPEQIGQDRLANAAALKHRYGAPAVAIDFGTAVTFSVISQTGEFAGGVIAPGIDCMTDYLHRKTARLPEIQLRNQVSAIGKTTEEAINAGAVIGHCGMVREIIARLIAEIGGSPMVVATGGGSGFAARQLPEISKVDPDLTIEGLRLVAKKVFQSA